MKIWWIALFSLVFVSARGQDGTLSPAEKATASRVSRAFLKLASADGMKFVRLNPRQVQVTAGTESCVVSLFFEAVTGWKTTAASPKGSGPDREAAVAKVRAFAKAHEIELPTEVEVKEQGQDWILRYPRKINGYESPIGDTFTVEGGEVVGMEREGVGLRPRPLGKMLVQAKDAVDIARQRFVDRFGDVTSANCRKTAYELIGSSEFENRTVDDRAPRRMRLSHVVDLKAPGREATIVIDVTDGEIVRDDIRTAPNAKPGLGSAAPADSPVSDGFFFLMTIAVIVLASGVGYWLVRAWQARKLTPEDSL